MIIKNSAFKYSVNKFFLLILLISSPLLFAEDLILVKKIELQDELNYLHKKLNSFKLAKHCYDNNPNSDTDTISKITVITCREIILSLWSNTTNFVEIISSAFYYAGLGIAKILETIFSDSDLKNHFSLFYKQTIENILAQIGAINSNDYSEILNGNLTNLFAKYDGDGFATYAKILGFITDFVMLIFFLDFLIKFKK